MRFVREGRPETRLETAALIDHILPRTHGKIVTVQVAFDTRGPAPKEEHS